VHYVTCVIASSCTTGADEPPADGAASGHILVVDDDVELCELLAMRARVNGYRVTAAAAIGPALEHIEREQIDVILLDLDLGGGHGFDVLDAVVARRPQIPIIVLTASGTVDAEIEADRRGAAGFVTKPFHHRDLLQRISRAVGDARAWTSSSSCHGRSGALNLPASAITSDGDRP
jgi:two-component system, NtrC family, response regulator GlrR